ncbi:uncharacterized protein LOC141691513 [Apium graveolens]|uniref:uncharacterized protein LOC141691513 n=1 Tax=Apium graveolens TaxID=4045 RepID=UPI003D7ADE1D
MGDLNNVTSQTDKKGGPPYLNHLSEGFNECLHEANLHDLDIIGHQFTWEKERNTDYWGSPSDHSSLLLCPEIQLRRNKRRPFRFENAWLTEPMCSQIIKDCWEEEEDSTILQKLSKCAESLNVWGKEITGSFNSRIKHCKATLKLLRGKRDAWPVAEFENTRQQLFLVLDQKKIFRRQRSKQLWLQVGEKNTKYFNASYKKKKHNNHIQKFKNADGAWQQQNSELLSIVTDKEVKNDVFHMHPDKMSGPDGMTPAFFQKNWNTVGKAVLHMVRDFLRQGFSWKIYPTRTIASNGSSCKKCFFEWVSIVGGLISVDYTIIHGERERGSIKPSRGLRQGDHLSPYLFIICVEGLTRLIRQYETTKLLHGIKICRKSPLISHLLFADDSYVYCKAELEDARKVLELLSIYEKASGQRVNRGKSTVFCSANVIPYNKEELCQVLQIPEADNSSKYLGLPNMLGRNKTTIFG